MLKSNKNFEDFVADKMTKKAKAKDYTLYRKAQSSIMNNSYCNKHNQM